MLVLMSCYTGSTYFFKARPTDRTLSVLTLLSFHFLNFFRQFTPDVLDINGQVNTAYKHFPRGLDCIDHRVPMILGRSGAALKSCDS